MEQNHMLPRPLDNNLSHNNSRKSHGSSDSHNNSNTNGVSGHFIPQNHLQLEPSFTDTAASLRYNHKSLSLPSYAHSHDVATLSFPNVPTTELAPIQPHRELATSRSNTLPSLSSLTGSQRQRYIPSQPAEPTYSSPPPPPVAHWPSLNPLTAYYTPSHAQACESPQRMDVDVSSNGTVSAASPDRYYEGRANSVSLDDPDVRMAAEALGDLRADFVSSPPERYTPLPPTSSPSGLPSRDSEPEPLLSLLTTSHPLLATTIEGATSAYNNSKNSYPRFKSGAEYVEGYLGPIANTVGSVGRVTGVEGGVRWFLGAGRRHQSSSSDLEAGDGGSHKRRKVDNSSGERSLDALADKALSAPANGQHDPYCFTKDRRTSMSTVDTLPAYDEFRSPAYSEATDHQNQVSSRHSSGTSAAWQQRLIMSTSGLSIAMSEESLRSLKYCLHWLRWANEHIARIIAALKATLDQYDGSTHPPGERNTEEKHDSDRVMTEAPSAAGSTAFDPAKDRSELVARITALKTDVLKTLRDVIETVSKYAGGALPENARVLVRRHLTSLPQRFRVATMQDSPAKHQGDGAQEKEMREGAQRVLVLAKEGLDMMSQVSGVLDGTIVSAEEWCERLGKKKREERGALVGGFSANTLRTEPLSGVGVGVDPDVKMG